MLTVHVIFINKSAYTIGSQIPRPVSLIHYLPLKKSTNLFVLEGNLKRYLFPSTSNEKIPPNRPAFVFIFLRSDI